MISRLLVSNFAESQTQRRPIKNFWVTSCNVIVADMEDGSLKILKDFTSLSFMPKAFAISALGNIINFIVLSRSDIHFKKRTIVIFVNPHRPCIKSTVNVYLSILAFADTLFSLFLYVSSRQYLVDVHHQTYEIYWRLFGLSNWFYTAFRECPQFPRGAVTFSWNSLDCFFPVYVTVYLTFSLTLDRYAAVSRPTRSKCGIAQAKNVVSSKFCAASILFSFGDFLPSSCLISTSCTAEGT